MSLSLLVWSANELRSQPRGKKSRDNERRASAHERPRNRGRLHFRKPRKSTPSTQTASTSASATPSPSQPTTIPITPSLIVTPSPPSTQAGGRIATNLSVWEGYTGQPTLWLDYPAYHVALKQGGSEQVRYASTARMANTRAVWRTTI
jgi:hypothetical protein